MLIIWALLAAPAIATDIGVAVGGAAMEPVTGVLMGGRPHGHAHEDDAEDEHGGTDAEPHRVVPLRDLPMADQMTWPCASKSTRRHRVGSSPAGLASGVPVSRSPCG